MNQVLEDVRVLDLSRLFPGPFATLLLSDLGAEVTKVEDPKGGDYIRYFPPLCDDGSGAPFHALNRGKKSIALDLKTELGKTALRKLLASADVLVESFRPGVLEKLGFAPNELLADFPQLIICRISGYGQSGPDAGKAGHDLNYAARAGVLGIMKDPQALPVQIGDLCGGAWPAAFQICAALFHRTRTGRGCIIDVSMTDGAQGMLILPLARRQLEKESPIGNGVDMLAGAVPAYDVYPTKEGHLAVGALEPKFWARFCEALGLQDIAGGAFASGEEGNQVRETIRAKLQEKTAKEWALDLSDHDCCVEEVIAPEDVAGNLKSQEGTLAAPMSIGGVSVHMPMPALDLARGQQPKTPCSPLGEDTRESLTQAGVDTDTLTGLLDPS